MIVFLLDGRAAGLPGEGVRRHPHPDPLNLSPYFTVVACVEGGYELFFLMKTITIRSSRLRCVLAAIAYSTHKMYLDCVLALLYVVRPCNNRALYQAVKPNACSLQGVGYQR